MPTERIRMKRVALKGVMLLAGVGLIVGTPGVAYASEDASVLYTDGSITRGSGAFNSDPKNSTPGDAINACDLRSDGLGVEAQLDINPSGGAFDIDRVASTRGLTAGHCSGWVSGDIKEDTLVEVRICKIQGGTTICGDSAFG